MRNTQDSQCNNSQPLELVRPRFFAGQSLGNGDLDAIMQWAERRAQLQSHCDDWGIACGLHLAFDQENANQVWIGAGYGFNSQHRPCILSKAVSYAFPDCSATNGCATGDSPTSMSIPGVGEVPVADLRVFQVSLHPGTCPIERSIGRTSQGERVCEVNRERVSGCLQIADVYDFLGKKEEARSCSAATHFLKQFQQAFPEINSKLLCPIEDWLKCVISKHPEMLRIHPRRLKLTNEVERQKLTDEGEIKKLVETVVDELAFGLRVADRCHVPAVDQGIPLARVWTRCKDRVREVLLIEQGAPYRRAIDCHPQFCWRDCLGQPVEHALLVADMCGVKIATIHDAPTGTAQLLEELTAEAQLSERVCRGEVLDIFTRSVQLPSAKIDEPQSKKVCWIFTRAKGGGGAETRVPQSAESSSAVLAAPASDPAAMTSRPDPPAANAPPSNPPAANAPPATS